MPRLPPFPDPVLEPLQAHRGNADEQTHLPTANLNDAAGASRSNIAWGEGDLRYFDGDDFTVPTGFWRIDTIRMWLVGYDADNDATLGDDAFLGDFYRNVSLYAAPVGSPLSRLALADFVDLSDSTNNPNVVATRVQYSGNPGELDYQFDSDTHYTIVEVEFKNLNLYVFGDTKVQFGMHTDQGVEDGDHALSHGSNAGLSGSLQEDADGLFRRFRLHSPSTATFLSD